MNQAIEFSVIIPTYNRLDLLKQALGSVWAQTYTDYEIIVVDDGSSDGTMDYLLSLGSGVKALRQRNRGPGAARNLGVSHAAGKYLAFLDSDDVWFPWTLATFRQVIRKHNQSSLISAAAVEFRSMVPTLEREALKEERFDDYFRTANDPAYVGSGALVVKRSVFDLADGFDESMTVGEDVDFYFRTGTCRDFVRVRAPVTLGCRLHPGRTSIALAPLYAATLELLIRERNGCYPGGKMRQKERWKLLSRTTRPVTLSCVKAGLRGEAWRLFRKSFVMNARLGRLRFLAAFALYAILGVMSGRRRP